MNDWGQQQQQTNRGCVAALLDNVERQRKRFGSRQGPFSSLLFSARQHNREWSVLIECHLHPTNTVCLCKAHRQLLTMLCMCSNTKEYLLYSQRGVVCFSVSWRNCAPCLQNTHYVMLLHALTFNSYHCPAMVALWMTALLSHRGNASITEQVPH